MFRTLLGDESVSDEPVGELLQDRWLIWPSLACRVRGGRVVERLPVGANGRRLVGVAGARAGHSGLGSGKPVGRGLDERGLVGRSQPSFADRDLALVPPGARRCKGRSHLL